MSAASLAATLATLRALHGAPAESTYHAEAAYLATLFTGIAGVALAKFIVSGGAHTSLGLWVSMTFLGGAMIGIGSAWTHLLLTTRELRPALDAP